MYVCTMDRDNYRDNYTISYQQQYGASKGERGYDSDMRSRVQKPSSCIHIIDIYVLRLPIRKKVEKYIRNTHISENCVYTHTHITRKVRVYTQKSSSLRVCV